VLVHEKYNNYSGNMKHVSGCHNRPHIYGSCPPSLCPSVPYGLLTRKQKGAENPELVWTFHRAAVTSVPVFISQGQSSRLGLCRSRWTAAYYVGTGPRFF